MIITISGIQGTSGKSYKGELYYEGSSTSAETKDVVNNTISFSINTPLSKVKIRIYQSDNITCYTETSWILLDWPTGLTAEVSCYNNYNRIVATAIGGVNGPLLDNNLEFAISTTNSSNGLTWEASDAGSSNVSGNPNALKKTFDTLTNTSGTNYYCFVRNKYYPGCMIVGLSNPITTFTCTSCNAPSIGNPIISCN